MTLAAPSPPSHTTLRIEFGEVPTPDATADSFTFIDGASDTGEVALINSHRSLRREFELLADEWHENTDYLSSPSQIAMDFAYQGIIGMGPEVIPFIVEDLEARGGEWYWALKALTRVRESPVSLEAQGNVDRMNKAWIKWLRQNHYLD